MSDHEHWQPVIGLEVHVRLKTKTKLFTRSPNHFGDEPNTNIDEVDTAQPGTLPVLNQEAVKKAVQFGLAIKSTISRKSSFDRKSYFYPDSPRNFQITQFFNPIIIGGTISCMVDGEIRHFPVDRAHIEDDTGMLKHFTTFAGIDYNRAGVPLIEVVSKPMMHSAKEAVAYAQALRAIMQYLDVSDCNMEEGSLRIDANISVRRKTETELRPKVEVKNMNSFHNMDMAIESEIRRQIQAYNRSPDESFEKVIEPGTYRFDLPTKRTILMRRKEGPQDYRYFHEPDLVPIVLSEESITAIQNGLPELPHERYLRYVSDLKIPADAAAILVNDKFTSDFFEDALPLAGNATNLCNWLIVEFSGRLKEKGISLEKSGLKSAHIGHLVKMIDDKVITGRMAKEVADEMLKSPGKDSLAIVKGNPNYQPLQDDILIESIIDQIIKENPQSIVDIKAGRTKALGFIVGQVMKLTQGKASPDVVNEILRKKIEE